MVARQTISQEKQRIVTAKETTPDQAESELERVSRALSTGQQFVELVRLYLETVLQTKDLVEEDLVYREVVLNLRAGNDVVSVIKLNPPYNMMMDLEKVPSGRQKVTAIEPDVLDKLYEVLTGYDTLKYKVNRTKLVLQNLVKPDSVSSLIFLK
jgi:hypothetical protein